MSRFLVFAAILVAFLGTFVPKVHADGASVVNQSIGWVMPSVCAPSSDPDTIAFDGIYRIITISNGASGNYQVTIIPQVVGTSLEDPDISYDLLGTIHSFNLREGRIYAYTSNLQIKSKGISTYVLYSNWKIVINANGEMTAIVDDTRILCR